MGNFFVSSLLSVTLFFIPVIAYLQPQPTQVELASHVLSLDNRQPDPWVNGIFKDNILLAISYARGTVKDGSQITWEEVEKPFVSTIELKPGEVFAFHDDILPQYAGKVTITTHAHFNYQDGFKSDGYLYGDGVCHLASLMYWVAKDAGLDAYAPVRHDFAVIPDIVPEYGVSIY